MTRTDEKSSGDGVQFSRVSARRLLLLGGIALIVVGMIFGDVFAIFILHQNAARVGAGLSAAAHAALAGDSFSVATNFTDVGSFLENRGTKVDTHVHMIEFGYLALLLAVTMPWVAFAEKTKRSMAWMFVVGGALLPVGVFFIHYVGLEHSPLKAIGWASIVGDTGGVLVLLATAAYFVGLCRHLRDRPKLSGSDELSSSRTPTGRLLLAGGIVLILVGFAHGAYYAASDLYRHEGARLLVALEHGDRKRVAR